MYSDFFLAFADVQTARNHLDKISPETTSRALCAISHLLVIALLLSLFCLIHQIASLSAKIAKNHVFFKENKRVAVLVTQQFLDAYYPGCCLNIDDMRICRAILDIVTGDLEIRERQGACAIMRSM